MTERQHFELVALKSTRHPVNSLKNLSESSFQLFYYIIFLELLLRIFYLIFWSNNMNISCIRSYYYMALGAQSYTQIISIQRTCISTVQLQVLLHKSWNICQLQAKIIYIFFSPSVIQQKNHTASCSRLMDAITKFSLLNYPFKFRIIDLVHFCNWISAKASNVLRYLTLLHKSLILDVDLLLLI